MVILAVVLVAAVLATGVAYAPSTNHAASSPFAQVHPQSNTKPIYFHSIAFVPITPSNNQTNSTQSNTTTENTTPNQVASPTINATTNQTQVSATNTTQTYASCNNYELITNATGVSKHGLCQWNGGMLQIYAAGGNSGSITYRITSTTGNFFVTNTTNARCSTYMQTINPPVGVYNVSFKTGAGGGSCNDELVDLKSPSPKPYITPTNAIMDLGQGINMTASWYGGTQPDYNVRWSVGASASCPGSVITHNSTVYGNTSTQQFSPDSVGAFYICVDVNGTYGGPATLNVNQQLSIMPLAASEVNITAGQPITLYGQAVGGTAPYHYYWYADNTLINTTASNSITLHPDLTTTYYYTVTDSAYQPSTSQNSQQITVNISKTLGCNVTDTVYLGQNDTCTPFTVQLTDLGQPNSNGISPAAINVYYNGTLTNTTSVMPKVQTAFSAHGYVLHVYINQTFDGLYAYQKYAKILLNVTRAPGWLTAP